MSLFGDDDLPSRNTRTSALFDDEPNTALRTSDRPAGNAPAGLFADDDLTASGTDSPWAFPSPKKAGGRTRGELVRELLRGEEVPESYVDAYDSLLVAEGAKQGGGVGVEAVRRLFGESGMSEEVVNRALEIVAPGGKTPEGGFGRAEFNVAVALVGLAVEGEEMTLDGVDERRKEQERPQSAVGADAPATPSKPQQKQPASVKANTRKQSFGTLEADPWNSPDLHRGHAHQNQTPATNGLHPPNGTQRTTSSFTTSEQRNPTPVNEPAAPPQASTGSYGSGWGGDTTTAEEGFSHQGMSGGFGGDAPAGEISGNANGPRRAIGGGRVSRGAEEVVTVTAIQEKEGVFLFQHRNYEVASARRNSKVIRRYSDFVWLLDCLHKRYPFRQLPLLPPKRVAINGNYLAADASFIEKRRRGLARFTNALVRHPVLSQEQLVVMFLTVPTELAVWRKQATISVQEEFAGKTLPPTLEDSLPPTLQDTFDTVRSGVKRSAEMYIGLCNMMERLCKRNEGIAVENARFSQALQKLTEVTKDTYAIDTNDVPLLNQGLSSTAKHLSASQSLLEDEARAWDEGVLEDLKMQRDCLVAMRDLFERRDRLAKDNIPQLEKRIQSNENKLQGLRSRPEGAGKPGDVEKVEEAIVRDKQSIVNQHARGVFIKECVRDELLFFQQSQYHVSRLHQDWSQERVKYAELQADNWRALSEEVEGMPLGD
ncbi:hypothetical protein W97_08753 [Coniosporium apollinis CBS 100218]|uniref:Sorting nexin MVP1 n=1 Tax=Coniosporium apollinis (strain CBS 100218) TaxID=1168221 RepID=R7Z5W0_CONA1|nr:uncharacterized protein W97_08753 [Coniosporium apollinis CBS 100218]EON69493.1 hypothetical protein W97_08753 [Coniosporium apollinis CBS 100218]